MLRIAAIHPVPDYASVAGATTRADFGRAETIHVTTQMRQPPDVYKGLVKSEGGVPSTSVLVPIKNVLAPGGYLEASIEACDRVKNAKLFEHPVPRDVVDAKWRSFGEWCYNIETVVYALLLALDTALAVAVKQGDPTSSLLAVGVVLVSTLFIVREGFQLVSARSKADYFTDPWNWLGLGAHLSAVAAALMVLRDSTGASARSVLSAAQIPLYVNVLFYVRGESQQVEYRLPHPSSRSSPRPRSARQDDDRHLSRRHQPLPGDAVPLLSFRAGLLPWRQQAGRRGCVRPLLQLAHVGTVGVPRGPR